jgi:ABC-2 type transport system permease protein
MSAETAFPAIRLRPRSKYAMLANMAMQRVMIYRRTLFTNFTANLVWVAVFYFLWQAVFAVNAHVGSFDWDMMRTYLILAYASNMLLTGSNSIYRTVSAIRFGDIGLEICRPYNFLLAQLSMSFGPMLIEGGLSAVVVITLGALVLHIQLPVSLLAGLFYLLSVFLGFLVRFLIIYIVSLLCFWTINYMGLTWAHTAITNLFSGGLIPLEFFPGWLRTLAAVLPFQAIVNTPLLIYLGQIQGWGIAGALGLQLLWIAALFALGTWMWTPCLKALEIQGG